MKIDGLSRPEINSRLFELQKGKSPLTDRTLHGVLEKHHDEELANGGKNTLKNLVLVPKPEHIGIHFLRSLPSSGRQPDDRSREIDTVFGRIGELDGEERKEFENFVWEKSGIRIRIY